MISSEYTELPQAPVNHDYKRIPLAVIYPKDGIEFIMIHTDADGEWSKTFRTGDDLGVYDFTDNSPIERYAAESQLKKLGWEVIIDD